jgi:hypothetical protein
MFRLVTEVEAPWPVRFEVVNEAGAVEEAEITLTFRRIGLKEFRALFGQPPGDGEDVIAHNRQLFDRLVTGWKGVVDAGGKPLAFTDENIEALLDFPGFATAFGRAYSEFWSALPEAREKNSAPSPAGGPATEALTAEAPNSGRA